MAKLSKAPTVNEFNSAIRAVFKTTEGRRLLDIMERQIEAVPIFNSDPIIIAHNAARRDFFDNIKLALKYTDKELIADIETVFDPIDNIPENIEDLNNE